MNCKTTVLLDCVCFVQELAFFFHPPSRDFICLLIWKKSIAFQLTVFIYCLLNLVKYIVLFFLICFLVFLALCCFFSDMSVLLSCPCLVLPLSCFALVLLCLFLTVFVLYWLITPFASVCFFPCFV